MSRRRDERGFTIVELLVAMMVLGIVVAGAMTMMQVVLRQSRGTVERTDAMQRGRLVLDTLTREIRSQVCLNPTTYGLHSASKDSITFYSEFDADDASPPRLNRLTFDETAGTITRTVWNTTTAGPIGYPAAPVSTQIVANRIARTGPNAPFFVFNAFTDDTPPTPTEPLTPTQLADPDDRIRTAKIDIAFTVLPTRVGSAKDDFGTQVEDSVFLRSADPNATTPDPTCR